MDTNASPLARSRALLTVLGCLAGCTPPPEDVVADDSSTGSAPTDSTSAPDDGTSEGDGTGTSTDESTSDGDSTSASIDTDSGDALVIYGGVVRSLGVGDVPERAPALAGAEVCASSIDPRVCTTTDDTGAWSLMLPADDDTLRIDIVAEGHLGVHYVTFTTAEDNLDHTLWLATDGLAGAFYDGCGAVYPEQAGAIVLSGYSLVAPDTYEYLDDATASASDGVGPCYMAQPWVHDPAQTSTSVDGWGSIVFANVPTADGELDVTLASAGQTCAAFEGLVESPQTDVVRIPVNAGVLTVVEIVCAP